MVSQTKLTIRLPKPLKRKVSAEAKSRMLSEADVTREALMDYFTLRDSKVPKPELQEVAA